jgi:hypothetical protein
MQSMLNNKINHVRACFADACTFGFGFIACDTWSGCLDAPDYMPQGSVRVWNTMKHAPNLSVANRDYLAGCAAIGVGSDGPETAAGATCR